MKNSDFITAEAAAAGNAAFFLPDIAMIIRIVTVSALIAFTGCRPTDNQIDQQLMTTTTSPIPGATAKVLPTAAAAADAAPVNFCVTDAGYCPLAVTAPAGQNCICQAGSLMYGGKTNMAPTTFKAPLIGQ
jgi:hypothetical protein